MHNKNTFAWTGLLTLSQQQRTSHALNVRSQGQDPSGWYTWFGMIVLLSEMHRTFLLVKNVARFSVWRLIQQIHVYWITRSCISRNQQGIYSGLDQQWCLRCAAHASRQLKGLQDTQWLWTAVCSCLILTTQTQTFIQSQLNSNCSLAHQMKQSRITGVYDKACLIASAFVNMRNITL